MEINCADMRDGIVTHTTIWCESELADTIGDTVERFLASTKSGIATLREIYQAAYKWPNESVRCSIYRDKKERFKRVAKGVYILIGQTSASLLIHGNGRKLDEIEDNSIASIINDHPWRNEKAHKSGNQKDFADYETFNYTQDDFDQKARVLVDGGYLAEFLPVRSFSNREYLNKIEEMALKSGLEFYASVIWRKAPEGVINTGRTTKGVEQIVIFTKGKARCLNVGGKAYKTAGILNFEIDIPANKGKNKNHQAEKPIELYKHLIRQLTKEQDVCLDQFGGSCNMIKAAVETSRFAVVYELCKDYITKAVRRFGMFTVCEAPYSQDKETPDTEEKVFERYELESIPREVTAAQLVFLRKVAQERPDLLTDQQRVTVMSDDSDMALAAEVNEIYKAVNAKGYAAYQLPVFDNTTNLTVYFKARELYSQIDDLFSKWIESGWLRYQHENYRLEARAFIDYCLQMHPGVQRLSFMRGHIQEYTMYLNSHGYNGARSQKLLSEFLGCCDALKLDA